MPDRHGTGTNGLLLTPPDAIAPSFGPGSCERHRALARPGRRDLPARAPGVAAARHRHGRGPRSAARATVGHARSRPAHPRRAQPARARGYPPHRPHGLSESHPWRASAPVPSATSPRSRRGDDLAALICMAAGDGQSARRPDRGGRPQGRLEGRGLGRRTCRCPSQPACASAGGRTEQGPTRSPGGPRPIGGDPARRARRPDLPNAPRLRVRQRRRGRLQRF